MHGRGNPVVVEKPPFRPRLLLSTENYMISVVFGSFPPDVAEDGKAWGSAPAPRTFRGRLLPSVAAR